MWLYDLSQDAVMMFEDLSEGQHYISVCVSQLGLQDFVEMQMLSKILVDLLHDMYGNI